MTTVTRWTGAACAPFETAWREGRVEKVVDGDTFDVLVDLGFESFREVRVRLVGEEWLRGRKIGFDAWEVRGPSAAIGKVARTRVAELLAVGQVVRIRSWLGGTKEGRGRWLCLILVQIEGAWISLADLLLAEGHGRRWWEGIDDGKPCPS